MNQDPELLPTDPNFNIWNGARLHRVLVANPPCLAERLGDSVKILVDHGFDAVLIRHLLHNEVRFFPFTLAELVEPRPWRFLIREEDFMSFEDFVLLDDTYNTGVRFGLDGLHWLTWYTAAKENWERFNGTPPPPGTIVRTLVAGYGGSAGVLRELGEVVEDNFPHIRVTDPARVGERYFCDLRYWFREFRVVSLPGQPEGDLTNAATCVIGGDA